MNNTDEINDALQSIKKFKAGPAMPVIEGTFWMDTSFDPPVLKMCVGQQWIIIDTADLDYQRQLITKIKQTLDAIKPGSGQIFGKMPAHHARLWFNELLNVEIKNQPIVAALLNMLEVAQDYLKNKV